MERETFRGTKDLRYLYRNFRNHQKLHNRRKKICYGPEVDIDSPQFSSKYYFFFLNMFYVRIMIYSCYGNIIWEKIIKVSCDFRKWLKYWRMDCREIFVSFYIEGGLRQCLFQVNEDGNACWRARIQNCIGPCQGGTGGQTKTSLGFGFRLERYARGWAWLGEFEDTLNCSTNDQKAVSKNH